MASPSRKPLRVALQGGGALGAYSAGVLDALLASRRVELTHFSGTSAGAINAVVCASALARGGRPAARRALASFWQDIAASPFGDYVGLLWGPIGQTLRQRVGEWIWYSTASLPSPYGGQLLPSPAATPLATVLARHVDFDALRAPAAAQVFVTVTHVATGLPRVFGNAELSLDAILASACLPQYFRAVEIDGDAYWDGGYTGNPTLWPLIRQPGASDVLLVQLAPAQAGATPTSAAGVRQRIAEIVFHSSLVAEMQAVQALRESAQARGDANRFSEARFHRIGPPPEALLGAGASVDRSPAFLRALGEAGGRDARAFLARHGDRIGVAETLDLRATFIAPHKTRLVARGAEVSTPALAA
ncbi:MAG: patatin-like phospholipase family protein [Lautropia sp.]